ncbi:TIGR00266 family protein [Roseibacillus ishigakijimensis]|uniref:TIGR00266 family protein n=1 Tax=Roseibacillus ishigakijimensis TaxID=454146 RepID=A0A934RT91_9BACT|nr:TIGR00266 family protein [Roseibacillus ishigakijimensis]
METWFYLDKQNQRKEAREDELGSLANSGEISPKSLTWREGLPEWVPAGESLPGLFADRGAVAPPPIPANVVVGPAPGQKCHEVDYELFGDDMQIVEVELDPGETVIAEAGAMNYVEQDITFEAKMGDGSEANEGIMGKLLAVGKRALTGESIFMTHFTHAGGSGKRRVSFAAPYPGKIIPLDMREIGGTITCQKDAFLCAAYGTKVSIAFNRKLGTGFFGGEGFIMQKLEGDGMAFMHAGGTVIKKELKGETLRVDTGCLVALSEGIDYGIERAGNLKSMFFGGEGLFLATLRGHGTVWLQSLPFSRMADRIIKSAPSAGGSRQGEGSVLGALGGLLDGDN